MDISIDRSSSTPVYLQIRNKIRDMIISGEIPKGFRLPPERSFAEKLGVNRSTVLNAYRELKADALVASRVGQGTVVISGVLENHSEAFRKFDPVPWRQYFNQSAIRTRGPLLRDLMELANREDVISFAAGITPPEFYPMELLRDVQEKVIKDYGPRILLHTPTEGHYPLRESISMMLKNKGISAAADEIIILSGSQQGLDITARVFIDPGDIVIVEEPSFFCALQIFEGAGAKLVSVPMDEKGMRVDVLEQLLTRYKPKFIYTVPTFQNPSGVTMDLKRRHQLLELAYRYQIPIMEDDPYGELRYEGSAIPPLKALDNYGYVMYLSTFSKLLFPGLRIGWLAAPKPVIRQFALAKQVDDLHSNSISQWILDMFLREGQLPGHIKRVSAEYLNRRDCMLEALERQAPAEVSWNRPLGGLYIWCSLPQQIIQSKLMARAEEHKVAFVPGNTFFVDGQGENYIRLNFSFTSGIKIKEGIKRLMKAINETLSDINSIDNRKKYEMMPIV